MTVEAPPVPPQFPQRREPADGYQAVISSKIPAGVWHALAEQAVTHGVHPVAALTGAFCRVVGDWSKSPRFELVVDATSALAGIVVVDADPALSFGDHVRTQHHRRYRALPLELMAGIRHRIEQEPDGLLLTWDSAGLPLPADMLADLVEGHVGLIRRLASDATAWTGPLPDLLPGGQRRVREDVNTTTASRPKELLHEPFWRQADRTPDAPAVIAVDRTLGYRTLRSAAADVAHRLITECERPRLVAIVLGKGWEQAAAVLGVLASGAAYVPIASDVPAERLHHLLEHSEAGAVVTSPALAAALPWPDGLPLVTLDERALADPEFGGRFTPPPDMPDHRDLAYIIYTSGSTGSPKGVMIDHRGAHNTIADINERFGIGSGDRVFALSSLTFDLSVYDILGPLSAGGAVVMPAPGTERAPWEWADAIAEHRVTFWDTVPALMEMLVEYTAGRGLRLPDSLRLVLMSGDWIPVTLPDRIRALARPDIQVIGGGGATEASIWSNVYAIGEVDAAWTSIPYGKPLTNQFFEVLDGAMRRRPVWVPGELHIGGHGVAMGYWRDPDRTAASFVTHPLTGERLYRTGDLGRYLPDGNLEFLGREDFQVKIHGFRVELGEIEAALLTHEEVTGAAVVAIDTPGGGKRLIGYVTPDDAPVAELREYLAAKLPGYLVPEMFVAMEAFPLSSNGKVDRGSLPAPDGSRR